MKKPLVAAGALALVAFMAVMVMGTIHSARAGTITNTTWPELKCKYCGCCKPIKTIG